MVWITNIPYMGSEGRAIHTYRKAWRGSFTGICTGYKAIGCMDYYWNETQKEGMLFSGCAYLLDSSSDDACDSG